LRAAFAGTPEFALPALAALCTQHQVVGVLTPPDRPSGRGRRLTASPVKVEALRRGLPLAQPATLRDGAALAQLAAWGPQVLVVVAYGKLLPPEVLALPPRGCLNIHASLLPRWRGAAPIERALLAGDRATGITIMQMDAGLDTGPMLLQRRLDIADTDTGGTLSAELAVLGAAALTEALAGLAAGTLRSVPQPSEGVTYASKIDKREARIDWRGSAAQIERQVRAFNPRPMAETLDEGEQVRILEARAVIVGDHDVNGDKKASKSLEPGTIAAVGGDAVQVQCGDGLLAIARVQRPGRRPVSGREYAQSRLGRRLG
jgi:methionyl-tRNA formyltransferase